MVARPLGKQMTPIALSPVASVPYSEDTNGILGFIVDQFKVRSNPVADSTKNDGGRPLCSHCGNVGANWKKCGRCKRARYCS